MTSEMFNARKAPRTFAYVVDHEVPFVRCNRCGSPVLRCNDFAKAAGYKYECMSCDEDLYGFETHIGKYRSRDELNQLFLNAESVLCLDEDS